MWAVVGLSAFCFVKQKTAYEMRISDWSSDVCSSDLKRRPRGEKQPRRGKMFAIGIGHDEIGGIDIVEMIEFEPARERRNIPFEKIDEAALSRLEPRAKGPMLARAVLEIGRAHV